MAKKTSKTVSPVDTLEVAQIGAATLLDLCGSRNGSGILLGRVAHAVIENKVRSSYPYHRLIGTFSMLAMGKDGSQKTAQSRVAVIPAHLEESVAAALDEASVVEFACLFEGGRARFAVAPRAVDAGLDHLLAELQPAVAAAQ